MPKKKNNYGSMRARAEKGDMLGSVLTGLGLKAASTQEVKAPELATDSADFGDIYTQQYQPGAEAITAFTEGPGFQAQWVTDPETGERVAQGDMAKLFQERQARVQGGVRGPSASATMAKKALAADEQKRLDASLAENLASVSQMAGGDLSRADKLRLSQQATKGASAGRQNIRSQTAARTADVTTADLASQEERLRQEQDLLGQDVGRISQFDTSSLAGKRAGLDVWAAPMQYQMGNISQNVQNQFQANLANTAAYDAAQLGQQQAFSNLVGAGVSAAGSYYQGAGAPKR